MQYRKMKDGTEISALGFGCMRLPLKDEALCKKLVVSALDKGINYFDTAYMYSGNEEVLGRILPHDRRSEYYIATKIPPAMCKSVNDFEKIFQTQLKRLQTDYIDFFLVHSVSDYESWARLRRFGVCDWLEEKVKSGKIRKVGFSYHGAYADFCKLIDDYNWDFTQVQYNYIDTNNQAGVAGVDYAYSKGVSVFVMEPLRGGSLTYKLPEEAKELLKNEKMSAAETGLRFVWNHPGVTMLLSGMNQEDQLEQNIATAENALPESLTDKENEVIAKIRDCFNKYAVVGCTGCRYCMPCPYGVNIPGCFSARNEFEYHKHGAKKKLGLNPARHQYANSAGLFGTNPASASLCKKCGACEKKCPQGIQIRAALEETAKVLEPAWFTTPLKIYAKFNSRK